MTRADAKRGAGHPSDACRTKPCSCREVVRFGAGGQGVGGRMTEGAGGSGVAVEGVRIGKQSRLL